MKITVSYTKNIGSRKNKKGSLKDLEQVIGEHEKGIVFLEGYSGCGKSAVVKKCFPENMKILTSEDFIMEIIQWLIKPESKYPESFYGDIVCLDHMDMLAKNEELQELGASIVKEMSCFQKFIILGIKMRERIPEFIKNTGECKYIIWEKKVEQ